MNKCMYAMPCPLIILLARGCSVTTTEERRKAAGVARPGPDQWPYRMCTRILDKGMAMGVAACRHVPAPVRLPRSYVNFTLY
jgi:hypothetical protein